LVGESGFARHVAEAYRRVSQLAAHRLQPQSDDMIADGLSAISTKRPA
jgi:hypothetical protein